MLSIDSALPPSSTAMPGDAVHVGHGGGDRVGAVRGDVGHARPGVVGVGVADPDRQTARERELGGGRVHDAAAVTGHLEQLVGADRLEHRRAVARARIGGHHAVDVGVDLHLARRSARCPSAHAVVSDPPRPSVVSAPFSAMPWNPATTGTSPRGDRVEQRGGVDLGDRAIAVDAVGADARLAAGERAASDSRSTQFVRDDHGGYRPRRIAASRSRSRSSAGRPSTSPSSVSVA